MRNFIKVSIFVLFISYFLGFAGSAKAYYPTLNVYSSGGSQITMTISNGQPNASVVISFTPSGSSLPQQINGTTDYNGSFTTIFSSGGMSIGSQIYATVGGQSVSTSYGSGGGNTGCSYYGCYVNGLTLSQSSVNLSVGQTASVTANYANSGYSYNYINLYISSNSNSSVATASVSGNTINIYGSQSGSTTVAVCQTSGNCANLYVTVSGGSSCGYYGCVVGGLTLSQNNLTLSAGQSASVTVTTGSYIYSGSYYISSNSNSSVATASISGNAINIYGNQSGSTSLYICQNSGSSCVTLYITVSGVLGANTNLWFSPSSATLYAGQSLAISINSGSYAYGSTYGSSAYYYVSSNSNSSVVTATINGTVLNLYGNQSGSANITVCSSYLSYCGTLPVTVSGGYGYGGTGSVWFNPSSVNLTVGQTSNVTVYSNYGSGNGFYISSNSNSYVASANVSGNQLNLSGLTTGSDTISVCQSGYGCGSLYVTVGGYSYGGSISLSQTNLTLIPNQTATLNITGSGNYYVSNNTNSVIATASVSGNVLNVYATSNSGSAVITVCQYYNGGCATLNVIVSSYGYGGGYGSSFSLAQTSLNLTKGQTSVVTIYGNGSYYISTNGNPSVATGSISVSGSTVNIYGVGGGSTTIAVCQTSPLSCSNLYVTVSGGYYYGYDGTGGGLQYPGSGSSGSGVLGAVTYPNGSLISENGTIYITYKNTKTGFASAWAFLGLGFKFSNVLAVDNSGLVDSGYTVTTRYVRHPWGSWVKSGNTIYFVHETGLIPVPDWSTFLQNGGQAAQIVPANLYDFKLPILSALAAGDSRLQ